MFSCIDSPSMTTEKDIALDIFNGSISAKYKSSNVCFPYCCTDGIGCCNEKMSELFTTHAVCKTTAGGWFSALVVEIGFFELIFCK